MEQTQVGATPVVKTAVYAVSQDLRERLENTFTYHAPKGDQPERYVAIRGKAKELAYLLAELVPPGREQALALTKLEETVMHANAGVAREHNVAAS